MSLADSNGSVGKKLIRIEIAAILLTCYRKAIGKSKSKRDHVEMLKKEIASEPAAVTNATMTARSATAQEPAEEATSSAAADDGPPPAATSAVPASC